MTDQNEHGEIKLIPSNEKETVGFGFDQEKSKEWYAHNLKMSKLEFDITQAGNKHDLKKRILLYLCLPLIIVICILAFMSDDKTQSMQSLLAILFGVLGYFAGKS